MDKKIYSKLTKERREEFQIETSIYKTHSGKKVTKSPLSKLAESHIEQIYDNYVFCRQHNIDMLVKSHLEEETIVFDFVSGESYGEKLLALIKHNKEDFLSDIHQYKEFIERTILDKNKFVISEDFRKIFGDVEGLEGKEAGINLNIDMSFDNIIFGEDGSPNIIDYEWMFRFPIPIEFSAFRAINAFWVKNHRELYGRVEFEEILGAAGISLDDYQIYLKMDERFLEYVNGDEYSYNQILEQYKEKVHYVQDIVIERELFAQIFVDDGRGFNEMDSIRVPLKFNQEDVKLELDISSFHSVKKLRIDPLNHSSIVKCIYMKAYDENGKEIVMMEQDINQGISNAKTQFFDTYFFQTEDPQFIYEFAKARKITKLDLYYQLLLNDMDNYKAILEIMEGIVLNSSDLQSNYYDRMKQLDQEIIKEKKLSEKLKKKIRDHEDELKVLQDLKQKEIQKIEEAQAKRDEMVRLQQIELERIKTQDLEATAVNKYIQGTKAYKIFLKRKVEKNVLKQQ
ncbi:MAG TPA: hypothetical protein IAC41_07120 [Candidatus Merdenecus merdavium]|nr:hypothetical protein [Candidatus Merdenecus merdavium]